MIWIKFYLWLNVFIGFLIYFIFNSLRWCYFVFGNKMLIFFWCLWLNVKYYCVFFSEKFWLLIVCYLMEWYFIDDYWYSMWLVVVYFIWIEFELLGIVFEVFSFRIYYINIIRKLFINWNILIYDNKIIYFIFNYLFLI